MFRKITISSIIFLLGLVFLYSSLNKFLSYKSYISEIHQSPLLQMVPIRILWIIPASEIIIIFMLIIKRWSLVGLYLSSILLSLFTIYIIAINQFSYYVPCSCGGIL